MCDGLSMNAHLPTWKLKDTKYTEKYDKIRSGKSGKSISNFLSYKHHSKMLTMGVVLQDKSLNRYY